MTTTVVTVPVVGGSLQIPLVVNDAPVQPYPVVKWTSKLSTETLNQFLARQKPMTAIDFEGDADSFSDFNEGTWDHSAQDFGGWGLLDWNIGALLNAKLSMKAKSSRWAARVAALVSGSTTNLQLIRLGSGANGGGHPTFLTGDIIGTDQGHQYTGVQDYASNGSVWGPYRMIGIRGAKGGVPPWETFANGKYHATNTTDTDFEIDGRDSVSLVPVTASGIGAGPLASGGVLNYIRGWIHDLAYGGAITHYNVTNTVLNFIDMRFNNLPAAAINLERCDGSTVNIVRPVFGVEPVDIVADSDTGFASIIITDPVLTAAHPKVKICVHAKYNYPPPDVSPNKQLDPASNNHVTLVVNGQSRPDLIPSMVQFVSSYTLGAVLQAIRHGRNPITAFRLSRSHKRRR